MYDKKRMSGRWTCDIHLLIFGRELQTRDRTSTKPIRVGRWTCDVHLVIFGQELQTRYRTSTKPIDRSRSADVRYASFDLLAKSYKPEIAHPSSRSDSVRTRPATTPP